MLPIPYDPDPDKIYPTGPFRASRDPLHTGLPALKKIKEKRQKEKGRKYEGEKRGKGVEEKGRGREGKREEERDKERL